VKEASLERFEASDILCEKVFKRELPFSKQNYIDTQHKDALKMIILSRVPVVPVSA
jgi:hypothetical protein